MNTIRHRNHTRKPQLIEIPILRVARICGIWVKDNSGEERRARCPFCSDGRNGKLNASINTRRNLYFCHRCGESHNSISLYAKIIGTDNKGAYRELAKLENAA